MTREDEEYEKNLNELKERIFKEGNTLISKQDLLERFVEIDNEYKNSHWNLLQILANIDILIGKEPCEDAVSRKAVLDIIEKEEFKGDALSEIEKLLSVNPQKIGHWIPVSERLPEDNELVLFSTKTDRVFEGRFFSDNTNRQWYSFCDRTFAWNNVVIAWMPLPEPYKAESEVDNAK